jgi:hypothetical protein
MNLKTVRQFSRARQINLAEEEFAGLKIGDDGSVTVPVTGHQVVSILFSEHT